MTEEQISIISDALASAYNHLYNDLDAICDDDYYEEVQSVLNEIERANEILKNASYTS
ncbi:MAG: hypothetical protein IJ635_09350 [Bacteroidaceae bacterium]|nr:hypothetical protein [Bacteroidaceae bacterium]